MTLDSVLPRRRTLSFKLTGLTLGSLLLALVAMGLTLLASWQLEGGAAAVNDAGSERMRSYRLMWLLAAADLAPEAREARTRQCVDEFGRVLVGLEQGDTARPLFLPRSSVIRAQVREIDATWTGLIRPQALAISAERNSALRIARAQALAPSVEAFVGRIDDLVNAIERENAKSTALLRSLQMGLMAVAVMGAIVMIYLMFLLIIRPVVRLEEGMRRMASDDFGVRVPVETRDEFGQLSEGFNRMAGHLESLYATLEERVAEKTQRLAARTRELGLLYGVSAFLNRQISDEELCRGFLQRLMVEFGAKGGAVRLIDPGAQELHLFVHEGLDQRFVEREQCLPLGQCTCGGAALARRSDTRQQDSAEAICHSAGYRTVSVTPVKAQQRMVGIFNLFFAEARSVSGNERRLLEMLGRHLGIALENRRLVASEREVAVSEERTMLAQELHDSIAQSLAFLNIQTQVLDAALKRGSAQEAARALARIRDGVQESYADVRELLTHFRTRVAPAGIEAALKASLARLQAQTGVATRLETHGLGLALSPDDQVQVLHVLQEALSNVRKHAHARNVVVRIDHEGQSLRFSVRDDGCGFDPARVDDSGVHVGLSVMRERAARIRGEIVIESGPGMGTEVRLTLPRAPLAAATPVHEAAA